jgi:hypothetical protein
VGKAGFGAIVHVAQVLPDSPVHGQRPVYSEWGRWLEER